MSKRKGLSLEEKRTRMLHLFYEKKDVFNYKELEKASHAEKGITPQSVKDILQSLISDGYVDTDKIGTSVYYWAFPSNALHTRQQRESTLKQNILITLAKVQTVQADIIVQMEQRQQTSQRCELLEFYTKAKSETERLTKELGLYYDPNVIEKEDKELEEIIQGVNRWTDNLEGVRSWCKQKFGMSDLEVNRSTGIPLELESVTKHTDLKELIPTTGSEEH